MKAGGYTQVEKLSDGFYCQRETEEIQFSDKNLAHNLSYSLAFLIKLMNWINQEKERLWDCPKYFCSSSYVVSGSLKCVTAGIRFSKSQSTILISGINNKEDLDVRTKRAKFTRMKFSLNLLYFYPQALLISVFPFSLSANVNLKLDVFWS